MYSTFCGMTAKEIIDMKRKCSEMEYAIRDTIKRVGEGEGWLSCSDEGGVDIEMLERSIEDNHNR